MVGDAFWKGNKLFIRNGGLSEQRRGGWVWGVVPVLSFQSIRDGDQHFESSDIEQSFEL